MLRADQESKDSIVSGMMCSPGIQHRTYSYESELNWSNITIKTEQWPLDKSL